MAKFIPLSNEEINKERRKLQPGIYTFAVKDAKEKTSKAGNLCFELTLQVWDNDGKEYLVWDNLTFTHNSIWKLKSFCDAVGLEDHYMRGEISPQDTISNSAKIKVGLRKDINGEQRPFVMEYLKRDFVHAQPDDLKTLTQRAQEEIKNRKPDFDDDIPF